MDTPVADIIFVGGQIATMVDEQPTAEALAVAGGRIIAVGSRVDVLTTQGPSSEIVDLAGNTLMPAFIDSHSHFMNAPQVVRWANVAGPPVGDVRAIADLVPVLQAHIERFAIPTGEWVIGYGYDRSNYEDGREATVDDLDVAFPDHPILLIHSSNHGAVLNSAAFAKVGYDASTPTPPGGLIVRKPGTNEPAGFVMETAFLPLFANMPQPSAEERFDRLYDAQQIYARAGVTTAHEGATHAKDVAFLREAGARGLLYLDIVALPLIIDMPEFANAFAPGTTCAPMEIPQRLETAFGTYHDHLKLQGIKFLIDGSPQGKTAFWTEPLLTPGPGGEQGWRGQPLFPPEVLHRALADAYSHGIQVFCHANGDAAIDLLIDGARAAGVRAADDRRTVVIHSQCMRPDQLDAYVESGFSPSFFTSHVFFWGEEHLANLGEDRARFLSPMASAVAKGLRCSNHTDFSVTPMDPMRVLWSSVTRRSRTGTVIGPDERVDRWTGLRALTIDAAWQIFEEDIKGTLEPGKLADLVVLDANPLTVSDDDALLDINVVHTYKEDVRVFG